MKIKPKKTIKEKYFTIERQQLQNQCTLTLITGLSTDLTAPRSARNPELATTPVMELVVLLPGAW